MGKSVFFKNTVSIAAFAIAGTIISTIIVSVGLYYSQLIDMLNYELSFVECLCFGSLISATDPVSVLAIFKEAKVDPNLYANVFGESVLNDAVTIVLYTTAVSFLRPDIDEQSVSYLWGLTEFVLIFAGSFIVGIAVGLLSSILLKYTPFSAFPTLEFSMLVMYAYSSYLLAEGLNLSGIVAILFCGIIMAHYTRKNLSADTKKFSIEFFESVATLAETYVFLYLGLSIFPSLSSFHLGIVFVSLGLFLVARAISIFPLSLLVNLVTKRRATGPRLKVPYNHQLMMWFTGLRGAMAFALAIDLRNKTAGGPLLLATTMSIVLITMLVFGGLTPKMLKLLKIKVGEEISISEGHHSLRENKWQQLDREYIMPLFTTIKRAPSPKEVEFIRETDDTFIIDEIFEGTEMQPFETEETNE